MSANYLAVDLGAESGRIVLGHFDGERMTVEEVHRFPNVPVWVSGALWVSGVLWVSGRSRPASPGAWRPGISRAWRSIPGG